MASSFFCSGEGCASTAGQTRTRATRIKNRTRVVIAKPPSFRGTEIKAPAGRVASPTITDGLGEDVEEHPVIFVAEVDVAEWRCGSFRHLSTETPGLPNRRADRASATGWQPLDAARERPPILTMPANG